MYTKYQCYYKMRVCYKKKGVLEIHGLKACKNKTFAMTRLYSKLFFCLYSFLSFFLIFRSHIHKIHIASNNNYLKRKDFLLVSVLFS